MSTDIFQQMAKEWYWLVILGGLVAVAFVPSFLKGKCPSCGKRNLCSVELNEQAPEQLGSKYAGPFMLFYQCQACYRRFKRVRTGPLEDASDACWDVVF